MLTGPARVYHRESGNVCVVLFLSILMDSADVECTDLITADGPDLGWKHGRLDVL
jgi:hypothetical protein